MFAFLRSLFRKRRVVRGFPPIPKWKPSIPIDLNSVADRAGYYTDHENVVVIFKHGTCVVLHANVRNPEVEAMSVLERVYNFHPDFNPQLMDDGNWLVSFSQPHCVSLVTKAEFENHRSYIQDNHLQGLVQGEVLLNAEQQPNSFDEPGMIGLFGRARMFMDAQDPVVARILMPKEEV
ncbi:hypothetical protein [Roseimicrobium gellanilyticum]|nr:hypothetical protein [Roseimicrobium gellanilyticum]